MPKLKTRKSVAKRFRLTKKGKIRRGMATKRHLLSGKSAKSKRRLKRGALVAAADVNVIKRMLPYG